MSSREIALAAQQWDQIESQALQIAVAAPKVAVYDRVVANKKMTITDFAKRLVDGPTRNIDSRQSQIPADCRLCAYFRGLRGWTAYGSTVPTLPVEGFTLPLLEELSTFVAFGFD